MKNTFISLPEIGLFFLGLILTFSGTVHAQDGAHDPTFNGTNAGVNNRVNAIALQPDGKILIAGTFTTYNGDASVPARIIRLNADGSRDASFNGTSAGAAGGGQSRVNAIAIQPDGKILIGGRFTSYNGDDDAPDYIIRLNADGSRDASFNGTNAGAAGPRIFGDVSAIALQPDGKILIGGNFTTYNGVDDVPDGIIRLNADGSHDASFNGANAGIGGSPAVVYALALQPNGKVLVGGNFSSYNGDASVPDRIIRLNADGSHDASFNGTNAGFSSNSIFDIALQPDGKVLVGGSFSYFGTYNGVFPPGGIIRLNADGSLDASFNGADLGINLGANNGGVSAMIFQSDGKVLVGGNFTSYNGDEAVPDRIIRLNTDGTHDASFNGTNAGIGGDVFALGLQPDGKVIIGGDFTSYNGDEAVPDRIIRLDNPSASPSIEPLPTMSQWALIFFGISILALGLVFVYRMPLGDR